LSEAGAAVALSTDRSPPVDKLWKSLPASGPFGVNEHRTHDLAAIVMNDLEQRLQSRRSA